MCCFKTTAPRLSLGTMIAPNATRHLFACLSPYLTFVFFIWIFGHHIFYFQKVIRYVYMSKSISNDTKGYHKGFLFLSPIPNLTLVSVLSLVTTRNLNEFLLCHLSTACVDCVSWKLRKFAHLHFPSAFSILLCRPFSPSFVYYL